MLAVSRNIGVLRRVITDMYHRATTTVRYAAGLTEEFEVGFGLLQGSVLSSFLFAIIVSKLTEDIRKEASCI